MVQNIEKVLERGERIELLVDKTDRLNQSSFKFEKTSRQIKNVRTLVCLLSCMGRGFRSEMPASLASYAPPASPPPSFPAVPARYPRRYSHLPLRRQELFYRKVRAYALGGAFVLAVAVAVAASYCGGLSFSTCRRLSR